MTKVDSTRSSPKPVAVPEPRAKASATSETATPGHALARLHDRVEPLIERIDAAADELKLNPGGASLDAYKTAVRELLDLAIAESMQVNNEASLGLSQKVFSTIACVDVALAELVDVVLGRQRGMLKAAAIVEQIKGLLVDLYR